jgi:hypothetical protein
LGQRPGARDAFQQLNLADADRAPVGEVHAKTDRELIRPACVIPPGRP